MSLWRLLILGALVLGTIYMVASAVVALVPYVMGAFLIGLIFIKLQAMLSSYDSEANDALSTRHDEAP